MRAAVVAFGLGLALAFKPVILPFLLKSQNAPVDKNIGTIQLLSTKELAEYYSGKSALLVGGTRGVGYGTALAMANAGASITIVGRSAKSGQEAVDKIRSHSENKQVKVDYVQGDIGSVRAAKQLVDKLENDSSEKFDFLVVSAAVFPDWDGELQQEDGLDKSFAIAVLGRYIVYKNMHKFLKNTNKAPRVLTVLAGGAKPMGPLDRDLVTGKKNVTSLFESLSFWSLAHDIMQIGLEERNTNVQESTRVITHPGMLKTDLHRGQAAWFDLVETVFVSLAGVTEEECGVRQASILASDRLHDKSISFVDQFMIGRVYSKELKEQVDAHLDFLWSFLNQMVDSVHDQSVMAS